MTNSLGVFKHPQRFKCPQRQIKNNIRSLWASLPLYSKTAIAEVVRERGSQSSEIDMIEEKLRFTVNLFARSFSRQEMSKIHIYTGNLLLSDFLEDTRALEVAKLEIIVTKAVGRILLLPK